MKNVCFRKLLIHCSIIQEKQMLLKQMPTVLLNHSATVLKGNREGSVRTCLVKGLTILHVRLLSLVLNWDCTNAVYQKIWLLNLYKPFIIRKLIERGIVKTVKSAKKIVDRKDPVVWDILENVLKGHPVLLNRAPTLHRLGIQAFQPKLIEGKAIQLHPLVCTAFNADFDGDQMAVHLPLGNGAVLEAQMLMLASHNILNPANGAPITVPSQDMVLGLYYITKGRKSTETEKVRGEGLIFYSPEEVNIAYNEGKIDLHAHIKVKVNDRKDGEFVNHLIETTVGRVIFNQFVPAEVGYINEILTKKSLRDIIGRVLKLAGTAKTADFLDAY